MDNIYLILVVILFILAISDLIVGVSNDAVNFLNSAIGSKAAHRVIIMIIASLGIIIGTTFSSGIMEVARKGIFNPQMFTFSDIMIIFLAVMLTDVILLDTFNTLGLPTSTTVSIVFELLGGAVAVALIKISNSQETVSDLSKYINSANALLIISGILLSIVVAFSIGMITQFFARLLFSFNLSKSYKYFGGLWGGIAITAITYFILIKGAKGSSFITKDMLEWIKTNTLTIIAVSFVGWFFLLQILQILFKVNILKIIVLAGTFALAMAFAGNDLVNFIGVPLAGLQSFKTFNEVGGSPDSLMMVSLMGKFKIDSHLLTYLLLIAGLIMVITLWFSKKARSVTQTEINLSRQNVGEERFGSSIISRVLVRGSVQFTRMMNFILPGSAKKYINKRFTQIEEHDKENAPSFDLVRASVNLAIASIIISFATSLKLPLSTTYVTFMVAMGTSLADRAWGTESAVYRITGVIVVITGWFFTALIAFTAAFIIANIINWGGIIAITGLVILAFIIVIRTYAIHKNKTKEKESNEFDYSTVDDKNIITKCTSNISKMLSSVLKIYNDIIEGLSNEDRKKLKNVHTEVELLNKNAKELKNNIFPTITKLSEEAYEAGQYYIQVLDYLREMAHSLTFVSLPSYKHVDNHHKKLSETQLEELNILRDGLTLFFSTIAKAIEDADFLNIESIAEQQQEILKNLKEFRKKQIKRIKKEKTNTKNSILFLAILNETQNLTLHTFNLLKAQRDFVTANKPT